MSKEDKAGAAQGRAELCAADRRGDIQISLSPGAVRKKTAMEGTRGCAAEDAGMGCCAARVVVGTAGWEVVDGGQKPAGCRSYQGLGAAVRAAVGWGQQRKWKTSPATLVRKKRNPPPTLSVVLNA